ncbi:alpha/beta hydrolase fold domain-containing protein [Conservatibacter flavescens]|uniref:Alpha/beta hydrolase n=1 Tax=Conservatibacter flavescens TaxID=28161 RepID=A0A2M8S5E1_9PAST|nr:alpha/beta hydrolase [Conservatibacter flavescens]PJG86343.1 alpha/beta hydrolase [Conservatibacter flavescens]
MTQSIQSKLLAKAASLLVNIPKDNQDEMHAMIAKMGQGNTAPVTPPVIDGQNVQNYYAHGMQVIAWNDKQDKNQRVIFYTHGGGYIAQLDNFQINLLTTLAERLDAKIIAPMYPLLPTFNYTHSFFKLLKIYEDTVKSVNDPRQITIMGDSAGGGMALGLAHSLVECDLPQPKDIILSSPWLDIASNNPDMQKYADKDILTILLLKTLAKYWAVDESNYKNPQVSPIHSPHFAKMGKITQFIGTREILYPDNKLLSDKLTALGLEHNFIVGENMIHVYPQLPIPEGKAAIEQMIKIINE